jgi:hypothetical protein
MQLEAVLAPGAAALALRVIPIQNGLPNTLRDVEPAFPFFVITHRSLSSRQRSITSPHTTTNRAKSSAFDVSKEMGSRAKASTMLR